MKHNKQENLSCGTSGIRIDQFTWQSTPGSLDDWYQKGDLSLADLFRNSEHRHCDNPIQYVIIAACCLSFSSNKLY